jgi:hypothetical protein
MEVAQHCHHCHTHGRFKKHLNEQDSWPLVQYIGNKTAPNEEPRCSGHQQRLHQRIHRSIKQRLQ